jgi:hypothetical protein
MSKRLALRLSLLFLAVAAYVMTARLKLFQEENKNSERDESREKFLLTFHPQGYLKRIR